MPDRDSVGLATRGGPPLPPALPLLCCSDPGGKEDRLEPVWEPPPRSSKDTCPGGGEEGGEGEGELRGVRVG